MAFRTLDDPLLRASTICRPTWLVLCLALVGACVNYRPVIVDQKTAFERDLVGQLERLNDGLLLAGPGGSAALDPTRGELLQIAIDRQLLAAQLAPLKREQTIGENKQGLLELLSPTADELTARLVAAENALRERLIRAIVAADRTLDERDLPWVRRALRHSCRDKAQPGERVQADDGSWHTVSATSGHER